MITPIPDKTYQQLPKRAHMSMLWRVPTIYLNHLIYAYSRNLMNRVVTGFVPAGGT